MTFPKSGCPYFVDADRTRLKQVLINLVSNAIKYNQANGTVVVECVATTRSGAHSHQRQGYGRRVASGNVAAAISAVQPPGTGASAEEGTGIGLVMSKRLVELMGGLIGVESRVGREASSGSN